jgi:hypothetical protein
MKTLSILTLGVLAASLPLQAESPRYGIQGAFAIPLGDLKDYTDSKPGPGVGIHGTFDLGDGSMVRPRLDYATFPEAAFASLKQTASTLSLGGDYLYFTEGKPEGFYVTAGLAIMRWSFETKDALTKTTDNTTKFGVSAGVGYQWNATLGTEARFIHSRISSQFNANALQGGVTIRF